MLHYAKAMGVPTQGNAPTDNFGRWGRTLAAYIETRCEETPAPELPMGFATLDVDHRLPWRWADELGEDDLADEEEGNLS